MIKIKLDENLGPKIAELFRKAGYDVHTVMEEGLVGADDEKISKVTRAEKRTLVTLDLDFSNPLRFPPLATAGTIVLRPGRPLLSLIHQLVLETIAFIENESPEGKIWIVETGRVRVFGDSAA